MAIAVIAIVFAIPKLDRDGAAKRKRVVGVIAMAIFLIYIVLTLVAYFSMDTSEEKSSSILHHRDAQHEIQYLSYSYAH